MGWYPTIIENTLEENLTEKFWKDLYKHLIKIDKKQKVLNKKYGDDAYDRDDFPHSIECLSIHYDFEYMRDGAFNCDHMEHIGAWLWNESVWPLFKKHKVSGKFVLHHEDGGGYYDGIIFEDGIPYSVKVEITTNKGEKLA